VLLLKTPRNEEIRPREPRSRARERERERERLPLIRPADLARFALRISDAQSDASLGAILRDYRSPRLPGHADATNDFTRRYQLPAGRNDPADPIRGNAERRLRNPGIRATIRGYYSGLSE